MPQLLPDSTVEEFRGLFTSGRTVLIDPTHLQFIAELGSGSFGIVDECRLPAADIKPSLADNTSQPPSATTTTADTSAHTQRSRDRGAGKATQAPGSGGGAGGGVGAGASVVVAVKRFHLRVMQDPTLCHLVCNEVEILLTCQHPNIVKAHGIGSMRGGKEDIVEAMAAFFLVMEYVPGVHLRKLVTTAMIRSTELVYRRRDALRWLVQVAAALTHMHTKTPKIMHRDVKLDNMLLTSSDPRTADVRLVDLGLAVRLPGYAIQEPANSQHQPQRSTMERSWSHHLLNDSVRGRNSFTNVLRGQPGRSGHDMDQYEGQHHGTPTAAQPKVEHHELHLSKVPEGRALVPETDHQPPTTEKTTQPETVSQTMPIDIPDGSGKRPPKTRSWNLLSSLAAAVAAATPSPGAPSPFSDIAIQQQPLGSAPTDNPELGHSGSGRRSNNLLRALGRHGSSSPARTASGHTAPPGTGSPPPAALLRHAATGPAPSGDGGMRQRRSEELHTAPRQTSPARHSLTFLPRRPSLPHIGARGVAGTGAGAAAAGDGDSQSYLQHVQSMSAGQHQPQDHGTTHASKVRQRMNFITLDQGSVSQDNSNQQLNQPPYLPATTQDLSTADPTHSNTNHSQQGLYARMVLAVTGAAGLGGGHNAGSEGTNDSTKVYRQGRAHTALAGQGGSQQNLHATDASARSGRIGFTGSDVGGGGSRRGVTPGFMATWNPAFRHTTPAGEGGSHRGGVTSGGAVAAEGGSLKGGVTSGGAGAAEGATPNGSMHRRLTAALGKLTARSSHAGSQEGSTKPGFGSKSLPHTVHHTISGPGHTSQMYDMTKATGSLMYMAPEVFRGQPYNEKADVFSLGMCIYELLHFTLLIAGVLQSVPSGKDPQEAIRAWAAAVAAGYRPPLDSRLPQPVLALLQRCWAGNPLERPSMSDVEKELSKVLQSHGHTLDELDRSRLGCGACCVIT